MLDDREEEPRQGFGHVGRERLYASTTALDGLATRSRGAIIFAEPERLLIARRETLGAPLTVDEMLGHGKPR